MINSDKYLAPIDFLIATKIREYDLKEAGFNLTKHFQLLSKKKITYLETLPKKERTIQIGRYMRDDKDYNKRLTNAFIKARKMFFESNGIVDDDILSIKKDAIFLINKVATVQRFGEFLYFDNKNTYTSYHKINEFEFYFSHKKIDVKGISDSVIEKYHSEHMMEFLFTCMKYIENSRNDLLRRYLKQFVYDYKNFNLDIEFYRELTPKSEYCLVLPNSPCVYFVEAIDRSLLQYTNIGYNYVKYVLYFIQNFM